MPASPSHADLTRPVCDPSGPCRCPKGLASGLSYKYDQLWTWRLSHNALGQDASPMQAKGARRARQKALAALSAVYPGALRELERVGAPVLQQRAREALKAPSCAPLWLRLVWDYHALWHRGLAWRRFCRLQLAGGHLAEAARTQLAGSFASWYERAARQTPWAGHMLPDAWQLPPWGAPGQTLKQAVYTLLEQQYGLGPQHIAQVLWGETLFEGSQ